MHNDQVCVFLSHKEKDEEAARKVKEELENHTGGMHVHIFEDIPAGTVYTDWLQDNLKLADLLVLLYTDPTEEWDWCLFEAGWFTPLKSADRRPVVCIYNSETQPPKPLFNLEAVKAERDELVNRFLRPLYLTNDFFDVEPVLNATLKDETLEKIADRIAAQVGPRQTLSRYYLDRIAIETQGNQVVEQGKVPDTAKIEAQDGRLEILELDQPEFTWAEFRGRAEETRGHGTFWFDELENSILRAAEKRSPRVSTGTFRGLKGGKIYRPILYRVDRVADEPRRFYVAFNEEIEPELVGGPGKMGVAFNLMRLASRFRWEVTDPFISRFAKPELKAKEVSQQMMDSIQAIEDEAKRHKFLDRETSTAVFGEDVRPEIEKMLDRWQVIREQLTAQAAEDAPDRLAITELLRELGEMNTVFMANVAKVYSALIEADAAVLAGT